MSTEKQQTQTTADKPGQEEEHGAIVRSAGAMSVMTMLSRVLGLFRDMLMAALLGTSAAADAFKIAFLIPNTFRRLLGEGAMTAAFIPTLAEVEKKHGRVELWRFICTFMCTFTLVLLVVSALGVMFSPVIIDVFTDEKFAADVDKLALTISLNRIVFPYIALSSIAAVLMAVLNYRGSFAPPAFTPVLFNVAIIVCGWAFASTFTSPAYGFAVGVIAGGIVQVLFQIPFLRKYGEPFRIRISFIDPNVRTVFRLMIPGLFAVGVTQINIMISTRILTGLQEGSPAAMYYANRLNELALGIFAVSVATVILPLLSRQAEARDFTGMGNSLGFAIRIIMFITIPATVGLIVLREPIISILFQRGAFTVESMALTAEPLIYLSIGLVPFSMIRVLAPAFYALKKMKVPVIISSIDVAVNITLALILSRFMGIGGVALAVTCGASVNVALLLIVYTRMHGGIDYASILKSLFRIGIAAVGMGLVCYFMMTQLGLMTQFSGWSRAAWTFAVIFAGIGVFGALTYLFRNTEIRELSALIRRRMRNSKA